MSSNCGIYKVGTTAVKTAYVNPEENRIMYKPNFKSSPNICNLC
jgi:hypothetical protein